MQLKDLKSAIPDRLYESLCNEGIKDIRPAQIKSIKAGLLQGKNLLVCTPTSSGKTLVAELAMLSAVLNRKGKAVYITPLKALASEKFRDFKARHGNYCRVALSVGDIDSADSYLADYDIIICTAEKLDSLIRHSAPWIKSVAVVVIDEAHLLNDPGRGPTLEILITVLRTLLKNTQFLALSATIGNAEELAVWLGAEAVLDDWRPVKLKKGIYFDGKIEFF